MNEITHYLQRTRLGEPVEHGALCMFPLYAEAGADPGYLGLDEAQAAELLSITEVSHGGSVPELALRNDATRPVLLLDGEELVGAKQNRVLNLSVLAPPKASTVIPVSCVEAGRWSWRSERFRAAGRTQYARGRARKAAQVSESLDAFGTRRSDQGAVWADIAGKSARMGVHSATDAMADVYDRYESDLEGYVRALRARPGQTGALFAIGGCVAGCDLFDHPSTLQKNLAKLVRGYALDALEHQRQAQAEPAAPPSPHAAARFLDAVAAARVERYDAPGLGADLRLRGDGLSGAALTLDGRLVHLCAFVAPDDGRSPVDRIDGPEYLC